MNRIDKTSEPSMEDILASIRRIISDDEAPSEPAVSGRSHPGNGSGDNQRFSSAQPFASLADSLPEDEVLDLTDDFVVAGVPPESRGNGAAAVSSEKQPQPVARRDEPRHEASISEGAPRFERAVADLTPPVPETKRVASQQAAALPQPARPSWSRRELPNQPSQSKSTPSLTARESVAEKTANAPPWAHPNAWDDDIKMAVPETGPVSLVSESGPSQNSVPDGLALAARTVARKAVNGLDDSELAHASDIDFDRIEDDDKARISETIAHVLSAKTEPGSSPIGVDTKLQASVLDQVLSRDFLRPQTSKPAPSAPTTLEPLLPPEHQEATELPESRGNNIESRSLDRNSRVSQSQQPGREMSLTNSKAQFLGVAKAAAPEPTGKTLEDSVREMLRPMLLQWLNDNMPRILEDAIRKEISVRGIGGLLPDTKS